MSIPDKVSVSAASADFSHSSKVDVENIEYASTSEKNEGFPGPGKVVQLDNPLEKLTHAELLGHVRQFADEFNFHDILPELEKGALVARKPNEWESIPELDEHDRANLQFEANHKWRHPVQMYLTIILCSIGACVQGWDQTGSAGATLSFPIEFGFPVDDPTNPNYERNNWIIGLVNAAPYIGAFGFACWATDPVNHYVGRRGTLFIAAIFCLLAPIGSAFTHKWWELFICRILLGFGVGFKETTAPVLAAENAPTRIRGALVMSWQMWTAFGIFLGYSANLVVYKIPRIAWRLQLGSAMIPAIPLIIMVYMVPESPRWYIKKGQLRKAWNSLVKLRKSRIQAARDLYYIYVQIVQERAVIGGTSYLTRLTQLFYTNRLRQASLASFVVMIAQQMCGINIMAFYSSTIFMEIDKNITTSMWASFGFGLINFVFAIPALYTIDTFGRRSLLLFTFPQMFWTLLAAGLSYLASDEKVRLGLVALFIYLFTAFYSPGEGPVPFTYSAEVFPLSHRELGMAWAVTVNNFFAAILSLTFFRLQAVMTVTGAFGFYAGLNLVALVMIFLWVPETKQLSLEELDLVFSIPTTDFMAFQITESLPYFKQRWLKFDKTAKMRDLLEIHPHSDLRRTIVGA